MADVVKNIERKKVNTMSILSIQTTNSPAVTVTRNAITREKLVYIACANKKRDYRNGASKIVYIGTTQSGADRIASSAAAIARRLLSNYGVKHLEFFVVASAPRQKVKTWRKLERGLIITFRDIFGETPVVNNHGKKMKWEDELDYFTSTRLKSVIEKYSE
jgi:hypothetical protein